MAKKDLAGQINMFDVFRELEKSAEAAGEVEMVSLMPEREPVGETDVEIADEQVVLEKPEVKLEIADKKAEHEKPEVGIEIEDKVGTDEDAESAPEKIVTEPDVAMHREKRDTDGNIVAEISYINYNKVLIRRKGHEDILKSFDNSYDAVDYYVSNMRLDNF